MLFHTGCVSDTYSSGYPCSVACWGHVQLCNSHDVWAHFPPCLQLVSTVLTIALLGGAAWFYFQYGGSSSDDSKPSSSSSSKDVDLNDPLAEARKIMDKYKK